MYANVDAAAVLERAVAAGAKWRGARPEAVMLAAEALGDVRLSLGELERARAAFAIARRRVRGDPVERARLLRKEANVAYRLGEYAAAPAGSAGGARRCSTNLAAPLRRRSARASSRCSGSVTLWRGRPRESVEWLKRAIADAESVDAKKALAHALAGLDLAYNDLGDSRRAIHSARALEIYEELGDLVSQGGVLNNLGTIAYFAGRWDEALELYGKALAAWDQAGDTRSVSMASFNIGEILSAQGRLDEAEPLLREAERSSRAAGGATDIAESMHGDGAAATPAAATSSARSRHSRRRGGCSRRAANSSATLLADARARRGARRWAATSTARRSSRAARWSAQAGDEEAARSCARTPPRARAGAPAGGRLDAARDARARDRRGEPRRAPLRGGARAGRPEPARRVLE